MHKDNRAHAQMQPHPAQTHPAAGFGLALTALTLLLPFYWGAATTSLLFPLFVLVASHSDPAATMAAQLAAPPAAQLQQLAKGRGHAGQVPRGPAPARRLPIFAMALRPTRWLLDRMLRYLPGGGRG